MLNFVTVTAGGAADSDDNDAAMSALFGSIPQAALDHFAFEDNNKNSKGKKRARSDTPQEREGSDDEFLAKVTAQKERKREVSTAFTCTYYSTSIMVGLNSIACIA
jgi:hypothetical protein